MTRLIALGLVATLAVFVALAAETTPPTAETTPSEPELNRIRDQLVALEIEEALSAVNAILERSGISEVTRIAALDLRAQAHVASDDVDAAEKDYIAILEVNASYVPRREVTSKKAMDRFEKIRAAKVGTILCDLDPKDAALAVDGRPVSKDASASFPALAGARRVRVTRKGFDTQDVDVHVVAGTETILKLQLVPNARTLVVRTDIAGVTVTLDGIAAGVTGPRVHAAADSQEAATLEVEDVAIGEHELRLEKPCFATETLQEVISVDLDDRSPKSTRLVTMRPARTRVTALGARYVGELRVDGERVASLPLTTFTMCPGLRVVEAFASGRVVWSAEFDAEEEDVTLDLSPRPNAVLVGADWPKRWDDTFAAWSRRGRVEPPPGADLTMTAGWTEVVLPSGTDLAIGVIPRAGVAGDDRVIVYGPLLHQVVDRGVPPPSLRPSFTQASLGAALVDFARGSVVVGAVSPKGPAARAGLLPGDRLVAVSGHAVDSARVAMEAIAASAIDAKLEIDVQSPGGTTRTVACVAAAAPALTSLFGDAWVRVVRAAWASVAAAAGGPDAPAALAELALLLEDSDRADEALDAWRRVRAAGLGVVQARAAYAVGAGLQAAGKDAEAREAFEQARTAALAERNALLAAACADRLADLGVVGR